MRLGNMSLVEEIRIICIYYENEFESNHYKLSFINSNLLIQTFFQVFQGDNFPPSSDWKQLLPFPHVYRVTIRPGFPGHVLFFGPCPGVWAGFQKCPGFVRVLNQSVPDRSKHGFWPSFFSKSVPV